MTHLAKESGMPASAGMTVLGWMVGVVPITLLFALPLIASLFYAFAGGFDPQAWADLFQHPQLWPGLWLSLFTGIASTILATVLAVVIVSATYESQLWRKLPAIMGGMLALPHLALAIGLGFLIMPSGVIARLIAAFFTGWQTPPNWITTHDPYGLSLIAALVIKEAPFLIWVMAGILNREDVRQSFANQHAAAISLGHGTGSIWLRIFLPQLMPKLIWPLVIVFVYAATVVDMSLVIGPTQPPTLASVIWADINGEQVAHNARGNAGALFLSGMLVLALGFFHVLANLAQPLGHQFISAGPSTWGVPTMIGRAKRQALTWFYIFIAASLLFMSIAQNWPFPDLVPTASMKAWGTIFQNPNALLTSIGLGLVTPTTALLLILLWLENIDRKFDRLPLGLSLMLLGLPAILVGLGQYRAFLQFGLTGNLLGLFLAHLLPVVAYMGVVLIGPYRALDPRFYATAQSLQSSRWRFLWAIKLPLLKAPVLAALAVGFAVSFGQYIPAQLIAAGRFSTLPVEAVTLTSGTNRPLTAAFALLLLLPPFLVYVSAAYFGRSRWSEK